MRLSLECMCMQNEKGGNEERVKFDLIWCGVWNRCRVSDFGF